MQIPGAIYFSITVSMLSHIWSRRYMLKASSWLVSMSRISGGKKITPILGGQKLPPPIHPPRWDVRPPWQQLNLPCWPLGDAFGPEPGQEVYVPGESSGGYDACFRKIVGFPPNHPFLIRFFIMNNPVWGVSLFLETPRCWISAWATKKNTLTFHEMLVGWVDRDLYRWFIIISK